MLKINLMNKFNSHVTVIKNKFYKNTWRFNQKEVRVCNV